MGMGATYTLVDLHGCHVHTSTLVHGCHVHISTFVGCTWVPLKWLNRGLRLKLNDPEFKARLDHLDAAISERT